MMSDVSLRTRLILAFALLSVFVAGSLAAITLLVMELSEASLIERTIRKEAIMLAEHYPHALDGIPQNERHFKLYVTGSGEPEALPEALRGADEGDVVFEGVEYELIIVSSGERTFYFLYDFSHYEIFELSVTVVLLVSALLCVALALWLGSRISGRVLEPITRLVDSIKNVGEGELADIPDDFADDEIGVLAGTFSQYNKKIRDSIERERAFGSNASHELRTPLSVIAGAAEVLQDSPALGPADRAAVERIRNETRIMRELMDMLQLMARHPRELSHANETVDVNQVVKEQVAMLNKDHGQDAGRWCLDECSQLKIKGSRRALEVILRNLLHNAHQYGGRGRISITVREGAVVVEDAGPGIPDAIKQKVFERFNRGVQPESVKNAGIGLALVRQLCGILGWRIALDDAENGTGARITLSFTE